MKATWRGERLKVRRKALGLTMEQLANKIGASKGNIAIWESGHSIPGGEYLALLGTALNESPLNWFDIKEESSESLEDNLNHKDTPNLPPKVTDEPR